MTKSGRRSPITRSGGVERGGSWTQPELPKTKAITVRGETGIDPVTGARMPVRRNLTSGDILKLRSLGYQIDEE